MIDTKSEGKKISNLRFKKKLCLQSCYALSKYESAKLIFLGVLFTSVWIYCFGTAENKYSFNWQECPFDTWTNYVCQYFLWATCCCCISYYMSYSKFSTELRSVIQKRESMKTIFFLAIYRVFFYSASQYAVVPKKVGL